MNSISISAGLRSSMYFAGLFAIATSPVMADTRADSLLNKVQTTLQATPSLTAEFTATTLYPTYYRDTKERGRVVLSRPGLARIEIDRFRKPERADEWQPSGNSSVVVSIGTSQTTLIKHPDSSQFRKNPVSNPESTLANVEPLQGFFDSGRLAEGEARYVGSEGALEVVEVTPPAPSGGREAGTRTLFIGEDGLVHRVVIHTTSQGKQVTREIVLDSIRLGETVDKAAFNVQIPTDSTLLERTGRRALLNPGSDAPPLVVHDKDGKEVRLSDFKGKVVVLKFFATWCASCRQSLPQTNEIARKYKAKDVVVLAVDIWDSEKAFKVWLPKNVKYDGILFTSDPQSNGRDQAVALYNVNATPTEYVIGKDGKIVTAFAGYNGPTPDLEDAIKAAGIR